MRSAPRVCTLSLTLGAHAMVWVNSGVRDGDRASVRGDFHLCSVSLTSSQKIWLSFAEITSHRPKFQLSSRAWALSGRQVPDYAPVGVRAGALSYFRLFQISCLYFDCMHMPTLNFDLNCSWVCLSVCPCVCLLLYISLLGVCSSHKGYDLLNGQ